MRWHISCSTVRNLHDMNARHELNEWVNDWLQDSCHSSGKLSNVHAEPRYPPGRFHFFFLLCINPEELDALITSFHNAGRLSRLKDAVVSARLLKESERAAILSEEFLTSYRNMQDLRVFGIQCLSNCDLALREMEHHSNLTTVKAHEIHIYGETKQSVLRGLQEFEKRMSDLVSKSVFFLHVVDVKDVPLKVIASKDWREDDLPPYGELLQVEYANESDSFGDVHHDWEAPTSTRNVLDDNNCSSWSDGNVQRCQEDIIFDQAVVRVVSVDAAKKSRLPSQSSGDLPNMSSFIEVETNTSPEPTAPKAPVSDAAFWNQIYEVIELCVERALHQRSTSSTGPNPDDVKQSQTQPPPVPTRACRNIFSHNLQERYRRSRRREKNSKNSLSEKGVKNVCLLASVTKSPLLKKISSVPLKKVTLASDCRLPSKQTSKTPQADKRPLTLKTHNPPVLEYPLLKGTVGMLSFEVNVATKEGVLQVPYNCQTKALFRHTVQGQLKSRRMLRACVQGNFRMRHISIQEMQPEGANKASAFICAKCRFGDLTGIDDALRTVVELVKT